MNSPRPLPRDRRAYTYYRSGGDDAKPIARIDNGDGEVAEVWVHPTRGTLLHNVPRTWSDDAAFAEFLEAGRQSLHERMHRRETGSWS